MFKKALISLSISSETSCSDNRARVKYIVSWIAFSICHRSFHPHTLFNFEESSLKKNASWGAFFSTPDFHLTVCPVVSLSFHSIQKNVTSSPVLKQSISSGPTLYAPATFISLYCFSSNHQIYKKWLQPSERFELSLCY